MLKQLQAGEPERSLAITPGFGQAVVDLMRFA
jgi:hypothetical protein